MKTKTIFSLIICCFLGTTLFSQKKEFKLGKIDVTDLTNTVCPIDSGADAYFLGDFGRSSFFYVQNKGFQTMYERHFRLKILKSSAVNLAIVIIPFYTASSGRGKETISDVKGITYNLESGKIVVSKLVNDEILEEGVNQALINKKFKMPNVKEGSVIELSYKIISDFYELRGWKFQYNIPVVYSQYETKIPEYLQYKVFQNGYDSIKKLSLIEPSAVDITWTKHNEFSMISNEYSETFHFQTFKNTYIGENIKGFHIEPFTDSQKNYLSSLEIELESTHFPNLPEKNYVSSWESINENLLSYDDFGALLKNKEATDDIVKTYTQGISQPIDKAEAIYKYIRDNFNWNRNDSLFASKRIRKTIEDKAGNSADINLLLVTALKNAGFKAEPVVLSTRNNGKIRMAYPILQKLNYVIAFVDVDGKQYLLDATDKHATFGFIPEKCLNGQGRIISNEIPGNIDLMSNQNYQQTINTSLKINENGELSGTWEEVRMGYAAYNFCNEVEANKGGDNYIKEQQKRNPGLIVQKYKFENLDSLNKNTTTIRYNLALTGYMESKGNLLMIRPLLIEQNQENPFKTKDRNYPVDYGYNYSLTYTAQFKVPQGYQIESMPRSQSISLPDRNMIFVFKADTNGNKIQVTREFTIQKSVFQPNEYSLLKEFYNQMVAKEAEVIVLKKL